MRTFLVLSLALAIPAVARAQERELPKLVVAISIDQFRYDYLERFRPYFGKGGFNRLLTEGDDFQNCHYRHAVTKTAPGHATILSGVHADVHGIVGNDWLDRASWQTMAAVEDPDSPIIGAPTHVAHSPGGMLERKAGRSPRNFLATTVGDQLKLRYGSKSRVIALSNKDRAAILMGGKLADGAYWMENDRFITSRYYRPALPEWVDAFNAERRIQGYFGKTWERLIDRKAYDLVQGPDDAPGETASYGLGVTLPKTIDGGHRELGPDFYNAFDLTPFATDVLEQFAVAALHAEKLGQHDDPDLLCLSFSQIDYMGHAYGPDSHEMMDSVLRLDRSLADLFEQIDQTIGLKHCIIVLTADHGASPLPEHLLAMNRGIFAGRLNNAALDRSMDAAMVHAFGPAPAGDFWCTRDNFGYTLHPSALSAKGVTLEKAEQVLKAALLATPEISIAYTAEELAPPAEGDSMISMSRRSFYPGRSTDVEFVMGPYVMDKSPFGTNHGTPWDYDTHVPLVWFGLGVPGGVHAEAAAVEDLAPTLSALLGLPRPPQARGRRLF